MSINPDVIMEDWTLMETAIFLENAGHTGAPVINSRNEISGIITLRDIQKGRKAGQMTSPARAYMTRKVICAQPDTTIREIEKIMFENNIGHLPITDGGAIKGILTRTDYLNHKNMNHSP
jgi:tRNA nucleotidyltransferase (CCA-adding enzyme)